MSKITGWAIFFLIVVALLLGSAAGFATYKGIEYWGNNKTEEATEDETARIEQSSTFTAYTQAIEEYMN